MRTRWAGFAFACASLVAGTVARADAVADFYRGRTLTVVIGSTVGGSYDVYARAIARRLSRYVPGAPTVVVQNMPGASSLAAANYVSSVAPRDGTVIGVINSAAPFQQLFGVAAARFDAPHANWLPTPSSFSALVVVSGDAPARTFADLREHEVLMATLSPGSTPAFYASVFNDVFKTRMRRVSGHPGMPEAFLAMQRGEVQGFPSTPWLSVKRNYADLLADGRIRILLQFGPSRIAELPDVPYASDLVDNDEDRRVLDLAMAPLIVGFPYLLPPETPADRVAALRKAMMDAMADKDFLDEAAKLTLEVNPVSGEDVQRVVQGAYATPANIIERIRRIYAQ